MIDRGEFFQDHLLDRHASDNATVEGVIARSADVPAPSDAEAPKVISRGEEIALSVADDLGLVEKLICRSVQSRYHEVDRLSSRAAAMGGKRLRPMLVILSAQAAVQDRQLTSRQLHDMHCIAASVELVHAASLVHDDVMDHALERRHQPTIGTLAGNSSAILLGDYLFTKAYALAANCRSGLPARKIASAASALCEGELRQQISAGNWELSLRDYRSLLSQKTGALCRVSCALGAWSAGAGSETSKALARFGAKLGLAFQLFDDWLDYWGTEKVGKTLGSDLLQRKPTMPLLRFLEVGSPAQVQRVLESLNAVPVASGSEGDVQHSGDDEAGLLELVRHELDQSDASEYTLNAARKCVRDAIRSLETIDDSASLQHLVAIAEFSAARIA